MTNHEKLLDEIYRQGKENAFHIATLNDDSVKLKVASESGNIGFQFASKESASNKPYIQITYTPAPPLAQPKPEIWWE